MIILHKSQAPADAATDPHAAADSSREKTGQMMQYPTSYAAAKKFHSTRTKEEPEYIRNDPGLACLASQLGRINAQIRYLDQFKKSVAIAEEECKQELEAASREKAMESSSSTNDKAGHNENDDQSSQANLTLASGSKDSNLNQWKRQWDPEVKAEYFFNQATGEASWLDPRYGMT